MDNFTWVKVYNKIAHKIVEYKSNVTLFTEIMYKSLEDAGLMYSEEKGSNLDNDGEKRCRYEEIDPISFMNRFEMYSDSNRKKLIEAFEKNTNMEIEIPRDFDGLPATNPKMSAIIRFKDSREKEDVPNIWELFDIALNGDLENENDRRRFIEYYDKVLSKPCAKFNVSIGLFKIRPDVFLNLDSTNRGYINKRFGIRINNCPNGEDYLKLINEIKMKIEKENKSLIDFSYDAWKDRVNLEKRYWIYSPGESSRLWNECIEQGIMSLGWDEIGNLEQYKNVQEINDKLKEIYGKENPKNDKCALDDMINKVKKGDIIIAKKGLYSLLGYGEVTSDYYFDDNKKEYKHLRNVNWIKTGEWDVSILEGEKHQLVLKTLTDLTKYGDYPQKLIRIMDENNLEENNVENMSNRNYYWLNANPKIWSFSELGIGDIIEYTALNENGNKRRIYKNYLEAKKGDMVIAYESTPTKAIVGLCVVEEGLKDNVLKIKKLETLINPISYNTVLSDESLSNMEYLSNPQGSLFALTEEEYNTILDIVRESNPISKKEADKYSKDDFLKEVYMSKDEYNKLVRLLFRKNNIILRGAPGVGKTFMAKRLAYSILEKKDEEKVKLIQFHQSYSYEDFIEGYRPTETSYELEKGVFYNFCKQAENNPDEPYFFIIDEVNRGNLSKIFGELLMLIEKDKRGEKLNLAYSKIGFSVPKNLYIIGMMNTADRSLALIDYALRRRFAFYKVNPAFENEGFIRYKDSLKNDKFNKLIENIEMLNVEIKNDLSLGEGFEIGHSYFCDLEKVSDEEIESIITYEILPLLEEYWFDDVDKYKEWKEKLNGVLNG